MSNNEGQRRAMIKSAWIRWLVLWVPLMAIITVASVWFEFNVIMAVLIGILAAVLLYQRHVNKRSWRSIMWGVHARDK